MCAPARPRVKWPYKRLLLVQGWVCNVGNVQAPATSMRMVATVFTPAAAHSSGRAQKRLAGVSKRVQQAARRSRVCSSRVCSSCLRLQQRAAAVELRNDALRRRGPRKSSEQHAAGQVARGDAGAAAARHGAEAAGCLVDD